MNVRNVGRPLPTARVLSATGSSTRGRSTEHREAVRSASRCRLCLWCPLGFGPVTCSVKTPVCRLLAHWVPSPSPCSLAGRLWLQAAWQSFCGDLLDCTRPCCPYLAGCSDSPRAGAPVLELSPHPQELDPLCVLPAQPSPHISGIAYPCGPLGTQLLGPKCCHCGSFVPWPRDGGPGMLTWDAASIQPASATQETFRHNAVCPASHGPALHSG